MNKSKSYPDWFINELTDEETKIRFLSGAGTVSESVYFRCHNGHLNYKQIGRDPSLIRVGTEDLDPTTIPIPKEQKKKGCC